MQPFQIIFHLKSIKNTTFYYLCHTLIFHKTITLNELIIDLKQSDVEILLNERDFYIDRIRQHFPQLKIIARGHQVIVLGETSALELFQVKIRYILSYIEKFHSINAQIIDQIIANDNADTTPSKKSSVILFGVNGKPISAQTPNQQKLSNLIEKKDMVFAIGPAGTGKTYTGVALAVKFLKEKKVKRIILTRPAVEAGENLGFLPGDLKEKLDPYMQPLYDALQDMIPSEKLFHFIEKGTIQIAPLAFMRGRTLDNAFVILDEAQNTTYAQMKMFLTRMGKNAKFLITGDPEQIDLPAKITSGLKTALQILSQENDIGILYLNDKDVIRHPLVRKIIDYYKKNETTK